MKAGKMRSSLLFKRQRCPILFDVLLIIQLNFWNTQSQELLRREQAWVKAVSTESQSLPPAPPEPALKIVLLAGQSNMVGWASVDHLRLLVEGKSDDPYDCLCEYQELWNGTDFIERDDVYLFHNNIHGKLSATFGGRNNFGPELGLGWVLGDLFGDPVVLVKAAWGGKSLAVDFRPPSSGEGSFDRIKPSQYGVEYRQMISDINTALGNLKDIYPNYNATQGYEIIGFVWFQGWNDVIEWTYVNEYGSNLANFIRDVRLDLDHLDLPFIIGELGQHGLHPMGPGDDRHWAMRFAQLWVSQMPEFANNTKYVPTAPYVRANLTQYAGDYHYYGRADTYYHIGKAFAHALMDIHHSQKKLHGSSEHSSSY